MLIDTHCHLTFPELSRQAPAVIARARAAGVERLILVATEPADAKAALALMGGDPGLFLVLGFHPHEAAKVDAAAWEELVGLVRGGRKPEDAADGAGRFPTGTVRSPGDRPDRSPPLAARKGEAAVPRIVGIGETGLDWHYSFAPHEKQEAVFEAHLGLALELDLPVVIHARESERRVLEILRRLAPGHRVVFHCFSGNVDIARQVLDAGYYCSFTGVVTFRNAADIRESARYVPQDRLMLETDAPFLSPEPQRKVRPNEPALLVHTARFVAALRGVPITELAAETTANAEQFFRLRAVSEPRAAASNPPAAARDAEPEAAVSACHPHDKPPGGYNPRRQAIPPEDRG